MKKKYIKVPQKGQWFPYIFSTVFITLWGIPLFFIGGAYWIPIVIISYFSLHWFFRSKVWNFIARRGWLNLIPNIIVMVPAILLLTGPLLLLTYIVMVKNKNNDIAYRYTPEIYRMFLYLLGGVLVVEIEEPEIQVPNHELNLRDEIQAYNHWHWVETISAPILANGNPVITIAKDELRTKFPHNWFLRNGRTVFVKRDENGEVLHDSGEEAQKEVIELINNGYIFIIFPTGKREKDRKIGPFKGGAFIISSRTKKPIRVVGLLDTDSYQGPFWFCFTTFRARRGDLFHPSLGPKKQRDLAHQNLEEIVA